MKRTKSRRDWIQTFLGKQVFPLDPDPKSINIEDIAHALSNQCRFTGHCYRFYSVAEHSLLVSNILRLEGHDEKMQLAGLMHDASEAYLTDLASPLKRLPQFAFYRRAEERLMKVIHDVCGPFPYEAPEVRHADLVALATEKRDLMTKPPAPWGKLPHPLLLRLLRLSRWEKSTGQVAQSFLERFYILKE